jgi:hypothetical protein
MKRLSSKSGRRKARLHLLDLQEKLIVELDLRKPRCRAKFLLESPAARSINGGVLEIWLLSLAKEQKTTARQRALALEIVDVFKALTNAELAAHGCAADKYSEPEDVALLYSGIDAECTDQAPHLDSLFKHLVCIFYGNNCDATATHRTYHNIADLSTPPSKTASRLTERFLDRVEFRHAYRSEKAAAGDFKFFASNLLHFGRAPKKGTERIVLFGLRRAPRLPLSADDTSVFSPTFQHAQQGYRKRGLPNVVNNLADVESRTSQQRIIEHLPPSMAKEMLETIAEHRDSLGDDDDDDELWERLNKQSKLSPD